MASQTGGSIVWQLDIDSKKFDAGLAGASAKATALGNSVNKSIGNSLSNIDFKGFASRASSAFDSIASGLGKIILIGTAAGGVLAFTLGKAASAAFEQVRAVENASFALKAYEKDGAKVTKVLGELVAFARSDMGVLFQRDELFKAASNLRGFGEASDTLTDKVKILARGVSLGMITFDEFSQVVGRAASKGRLDADQYDILAGRGIILDKAFRGAAVSSEGLFNELQRVLPAELLEGRANTIDGVMIRLNSAFRDLGSAILGVDKDTSQFIKGGLGDTLINGLNQVRDALKDPALLGSLKSLGQSIGNFVKDALPKVIDGFKWLVDNKETIAATFAAIVAGFAAAKVGAIAFSIAASANPVGLIILAIAAAITVLVGAIVFLQVKFGFFTAMWEKLQPIIQPIVALFKTLWGILMDQLAPAFEFISRNAETFKKIGIALIVIVLTPLVLVIATVIAIVLAAIAIFAAIAAIVKVVYNAFLSLKAAQESVAKAIADGMKRIWNSAVDGFNGIIRAISGFVSRFVQVGSDIINGIARGIQNGANAVIDTIKRIASGALDAVKKFFGIRSPSKVMAGIGQDLMAGLSKGIVMATGGVVSAAQSASAGVLQGFGSTLPISTPNVVGADYVGANSTTYVTNVTQNNSGIVAQSKSAWREINKSGLEAVNEELRAKGVPEIGGGYLTPGASTI